MRFVELFGKVFQFFGFAWAECLAGTLSFWCFGTEQFFPHVDGMLEEEQLAEVLLRQEHTRLAEKPSDSGLPPLPWQLLSVSTRVTAGGCQLDPRLLDNTE